MTTTTFEEWKKDLELQIAVMDSVIKVMQQLRDSLTLQSYPVIKK